MRGCVSIFRGRRCGRRALCGTTIRYAAVRCVSPSSSCASSSRGSTWRRGPAGGGGGGGGGWRVLPRLVNQLRHSLTGPGVVEWFERGRADLDGASPADALDDPGRLEPLLAAAAASRGNVAA